MADKQKECSVEGCTTGCRARGLCNTHYYRWDRYGDPLTLRNRPPGLSLEEALAWHLPEPQRTERGCLVGWTGPIDATNGGRPRLNFRYKQRHAAAWVCELTHGPRPDPGYHAAHLCNNPKCLEPTHITWKTQADNIRDKYTVERAWHRLEDELGGRTAVLIAAIERYGEAA